MFNNLNSSEHSPLTRFLMIIMLLFMVLSFGFWGIGDIFRSGGSAGSVATVGKEHVTLREYQNALQGRQEEMRERLGKDYNAELLKKLGIERQALDSIINRLLLEQEAKHLGIEVSDDDVADFIAKNADFLDAQGQFSKELYLAALQANHRSERDYVQALKSELATRLVLETVTMHIPEPTDLGEAFYRARFERRNAGLLVIPASTATSVQPTDKDLKAYYDAHNDKFMVPEYRALSYVELKPADLAPSIAVSDSEVQKAYSDRAEEFRQPERRVVEQLLFDKIETAFKASAELTSGKSFEQVAADLPVVNKGKLQLGELTKDAVPVAADQVFALKEGEFTTPVQSGFGWHILHVVKILPAGEKPLAEVHDQIVKDISAKAAEDAIYKLSNHFEDAMGGGASLADAAAKLGQQVHTVPAVNHDGLTPDGVKAAIPAYTNFIDVAFNTPAKDHSRMVQADGGNYFLIAVTDVKPEHAKPLADVLPQVTAAYKKEQTGKELGKLADDAAKALKAGKRPEEAFAGKAVPIVFEPSGPLLRTSDTATAGKLNGNLLPQAMVQELFKLKKGGYTAAYPLTGGGFMIGRLDNVIAAPDVKTLAKDAQLQAMGPIREDMQKAIEQEAQSDYLHYLRTKYPVTINNKLISSAPENSDE